MFGPHGAGKGTQAQFIVNKFNYFQLSTGDLLRKEIKDKTPMGQEIEDIISKGDFATDDIVNTLLKKVITNNLYKNKIIFDGYPRNIKQAENLEDILKEANQKIGIIIFLNVSKEIIEKRIIGRITCEKCNITLNEFFNKTEINNHRCGQEFLKKRKDDNPKTIITRYDAYMEKTKPVLNFYSKKTILYEINGSLKIEDISSKIEHILKV